MIEIVKENGRGTNGHICIAVDDMAKAMDELKEKGAAFDESSAKYKNGELTAIYFKDEIAGFAIHLLKINIHEEKVMKAVTFGEIMMRLNPEGYLRFVQANSFEVSYAGGEANVAVSLANYGVDAAFVSKVPAHEIGQCVVNELRRYGRYEVSSARRPASGRVLL